MHSQHLSSFINGMIATQLQVKACNAKATYFYKDKCSEQVKKMFRRDCMDSQDEILASILHPQYKRQKSSSTFDIESIQK